METNGCPKKKEQDRDVNVNVNADRELAAKSYLVPDFS